MQDDTSMARCDKVLCKKPQSDLNYMCMFGHKTIYINLHFTRVRNLKDVEFVEAEI